MIFNIASNFAVVKYKRASKDDEPHLAFYQQKVGVKNLLWDGEKQLLVTDLEMMEASPEEAAAFRAKANEEFNEKLFKGLSKPKTEVTSLEASYTKLHEEEDNMEVVAATPKKPLTDFDILLAGEEDLL